METGDVVFRVVFEWTADDNETSECEILFNMVTLHGANLGGVRERERERERE